jgi:hypothetical protein
MRRRFLCLAPAFVVVIACSVGPVIPPTPGQSTSASPQITAPASVESEASPAPAPRTTPPPGRITRFDTAELANDSRLLNLQFVGGAVFIGGTVSIVSGLKTYLETGEPMVAAGAAVG